MTIPRAFLPIPGFATIRFPCRPSREPAAPGDSDQLDGVGRIAAADGAPGHAAGGPGRRGAAGQRLKVRTPDFSQEV